MKKVFLFVIFNLTMVVCGFSNIIITNYCALQFNFNFNNGYYCGVSATSPATTTFTDPGTNALTDFASVGGGMFSAVKVNPGIMPISGPMDYVTVGAGSSGFPSSATSIGIYVTITGTYRFMVVYTYFGTADIYISIYPA